MLASYTQLFLYIYELHTIPLSLLKFLPLRFYCLRFWGDFILLIISLQNAKSKGIN